MTAILKVDTIQDTSGNNIINESSDTITIGASGDTTNIIGTLQNNGAAVATTNGITEADQWRITANHTSASILTSNWERNDSTGYSKIGTGLSESSGVFSFATTGIYLINFYGAAQMAATDGYINFYLQVTTNNSSFSTGATGLAGNDASSGDAGGTAANAYIFDVTNTSTHKFHFGLGSVTSGTYLTGSSTESFTGFTVIRLGDT